MDFPIDQLDIKRKQIPKYGLDLVIRLIFNNGVCGGGGDSNSDTLITPSNSIVIRLGDSAAHNAMALSPKPRPIVSNNPINTGMDNKNIRFSNSTDTSNSNSILTVEMKDVVES